MVGYIAGLWCEPDLGLGAVVLQNGPGDGPNRLARQAIQVVAAALEGRDPEAELEAILAVQAAADAVEEADGPVSAESPAPPDPDADPALKAIVGHYRSHDPWATNFRVVLRGSVPWLLFTFEPDGFEAEQRLHPMARGWFRVGDDPLGPERMRFDTVIDGHTWRAWLSGWDYYRMGDP